MQFIGASTLIVFGGAAAIIVAIGVLDPWPRANIVLLGSSICTIAIACVLLVVKP
jgi:hypothetical protein